MRVALVRNGRVADVYEGFDISTLEAALGPQSGVYHEDPENKPIGAWWIEPYPMPEPEPAWLTPESVVYWVEGKYQSLLAEFPEGEKASWETQVREADALLNDTEIPTPFIDSQAAITGESRLELAQKILQKSGELSAFSGLLTGIRRRTTTRIQNGEQLLTSELETILATALGGQ
jgi:hypothetical protein